MPPYEIFMTLWLRSWTDRTAKPIRHQTWCHLSENSRMVCWPIGLVELGGTRREGPRQHAGSADAIDKE
jgi:hypothetical protein